MYKAKVLTFPFPKTYKCKGHKIIESGITMLILENEKRIFIPNKYIIEFSDGWFKMELEKVKKDSNGQAKVDHGLKGD